MTHTKLSAVLLQLHFIFLFRLNFELFCFVSPTFWRVFFFEFRRVLHENRVNVSCGQAEERVLLTGLHAVADIYCECCKTPLGWKYVSHTRTFFSVFFNSFLFLFEIINLFLCSFYLWSFFFHLENNRSAFHLNSIVNFFRWIFEFSSFEFFQVFWAIFQVFLQFSEFFFDFSNFSFNFQIFCSNCQVFSSIFLKVSSNFYLHIKFFSWTFQFCSSIFQFFAIRF